ncbi:MAG: hypothetical protein HQ581_16370, partial [Planctomycetes bacterium]|nr:hypothetical protein [Planctomycetota bacterium]
MPAYSRRVLRNLAVTLPMLIGATCNSPATVAAETSVGYLLPVPSVDKLGAEGTAAWQLARTSAGASAVIARGDGTFVDLQGKPVKLETFSVLWYHQGDSVAQTGPVYDAKTLASLRKYVEDGGGLYLSGAALAMVRTLNIEPVSPRLGGPGSDASGAALVPVQTKHPVFGGLGTAGRTVPLSDTGHPAFADFHGSGGPSRGMLLARSPGGSENPLVEYELGKGRIIAMGWRLPHYSNAANPHRANLERLTTNIFAYLGDNKQWRKVVITRRPGRQPAKIEPGVPESQWESLELAIADLHETFGPRYPRGEEFLRRLAELKQTHDKAAGLAAGDPAEGDTEPSDTIDLVALDEITKAFGQLKAEALLANPLMDFDRLMLVRRSTGRMGLPTNYQSNSSIPTTGYDNELAVLSPVSPQGTLTTLFRPEGGRFIGDVDLNFD